MESGMSRYEIVAAELWNRGCRAMESGMPSYGIGAAALCNVTLNYT